MTAEGTEEKPAKNCPTQVFLRRAPNEMKKEKPFKSINREDPNAFEEAEGGGRTAKRKRSAKKSIYGGLIKNLKTSEIQGGVLGGEEDSSAL